jgi:hypothetical protein
MFPPRLRKGQGGVLKIPALPVAAASNTIFYASTAFYVSGTTALLTCAKPSHTLT